MAAESFGRMEQQREDSSREEGRENRLHVQNGREPDENEQQRERPADPHLVGIVLSEQPRHAEGMPPEGQLHHPKHQHHRDEQDGTVDEFDAPPVARPDGDLRDQQQRDEVRDHRGNQDGLPEAFGGDPRASQAGEDEGRRGGCQQRGVEDRQVQPEGREERKRERAREDDERLTDRAHSPPFQRGEIDLEAGEEHQHQEPEFPDLVQQRGPFDQPEYGTDQHPEQDLDDHRGRPQPVGHRGQQESGDPDDHQRAGTVHQGLVPSTAAAARARAPVARTSSSTGQCSSGRCANSRIPGP